MALVLTMREGEDFYIQHERVIVTQIVSETEFMLLRERDQKTFKMKEGKAVEIFKNVSLSVGARGQRGLARVAIEAPRSVMLLRGDSYRANPPPQAPARDRRP